MKANTVFAVTMGKMSKIDANSAAIAANAEEIAEVRGIAEGATAGAPIPKSLASEMVEGGVYLYTGTETGYTAGHVYYYVGGVLTDGGQYGGIAIDDTLTSPTMAAPASEVGQIKEDLSQKTGLSEEAKQALLAVVAHIGVWTDEHGQDYYDALEEALYPPANITKIEVTYTQRGVVLDTDELDTLKPNLVVRAIYSDGSGQEVQNYALSGTLAAGTSTVVVSYGGKSATIDVAVQSTTLPEEYQRVAYIENDATGIAKSDVMSTAFIDAKVVFANTVESQEYLVDFERTVMASDNRYFIGVGLANNWQFSVGYSVGVNPSSETLYIFAGIDVSVSYVGRTRHRVYTKRTETDITIRDGYVKGTAEGEVRESYGRRVTLFGLGNGTTANGSSYAKYVISGRIYSAQVLQGGTLLACLIPCRNTTTDEIGFYDVVNNTFCKPKAATTFSAGADV